MWKIAVPPPGPSTLAVWGTGTKSLYFHLSRPHIVISAWTIFLKEAFVFFENYKLASTPPPSLAPNGYRVSFPQLKGPGRNIQPSPLARSQYSEGPATGHLDTGFSWFPSVYKQTLRRFPTFQVATTCFSCSPPDLNLLVTNFIFCIHVK